MRQELRSNIPKIIRVLLAYREISAAELGRRIGLSGTRMSEKMHCRNPFTLDQVAAMAEALDVDPAVWFDKPERALDYLRHDDDERRGQNWKKIDPAVAPVMAGPEPAEPAIHAA